MSRWCVIMLVIGFCAERRGQAAEAVADRTALDRRTAERSLMAGRIDDAVIALQRLLTASPKDGAASLLLCRAYYAEEHIDEAIGACETANNLLPRNSEVQDWLGRAYGQKADHAGPIEGFKLARRVRVAFETAVEYDPGNGAAVNDLSEYYVGAPSVVGGGLDKADALAVRYQAQLPQEAHRIHALAAMKRKDYGTAEREFQAAVDAGKRADAWADLGGYYAERNQPDRAVDALKHCLAADRTRDAAIVDAASILNEMHLEPRLAMQTLQQYLSSNAKSDAQPAPKVHVMLGKMLADGGDIAGARAELRRALEICSDYQPAKRALEQK